MTGAIGGAGETVLRSITNAGYAGYNIGNAISLGSTYINSKTGAIDNWISSLDSATNTNNTYHYGDITKNAGYVNPDGTGGRLGQEMAGATANSMPSGCDKVEVDYSTSSNNNIKNALDSDINRNESKNFIKELKSVISKGKISNNGRRIISELDDGSKVVVGFDVGKNAHPISKAGYIDPVDHMNIQVFNESGKEELIDAHLILDKEMKVIDKYIN